MRFNAQLVKFTNAVFLSMKSSKLSESSESVLIVGDTKYNIDIGKDKYCKVFPHRSYCYFCIWFFRLSSMCKITCKKKYAWPEMYLCHTIYEWIGNGPLGVSRYIILYILYVWVLGTHFYRTMLCVLNYIPLNCMLFYMQLLVVINGFNILF